MTEPIFKAGSLNHHEINFLKDWGWCMGAFPEYSNPEDIPDEVIILRYYSQVI